MIIQPISNAKYPIEKELQEKISNVVENVLNEAVKNEMNASRKRMDTLTSMEAQMVLGSLSQVKKNAISRQVALLQLTAKNPNK